ncbi:hypothetical protein BC829DRAFT_445196 [Chytridium lagenaria]|nr:hypothetical protein BC829DRAFT_445196 [Chytridium lagenaria]
MEGDYPTTSERIAVLNDRFMDVLVRMEPTTAAINALPGYADDIFRYSFQDRLSAYTDVSAVLKETLTLLSDTRLRKEEMEDLEFLEFSARWWCVANGRPGVGVQWELGSSHMEGPIVNYELYLDLYQRLDTLEDFENFRSRIMKFPQRFNDIIEAYKSGIVRGITLPLSSIDLLIQRCDVGAVLTIPDRDEAARTHVLCKRTESERVTGDPDFMVDAIKHHLFPAYTTMKAFLVTQYRPHARKHDGIYGLPNAKEMYEAYLFQHTTVKVTAEEVHEMGLREVARITARMEEVKVKCGFEGSLKEFRVALADRTRYPDLFFKDVKKDVVPMYEAFLRESEEKMKEYFKSFPKFKCRVEGVPAETEDQSPLAFYLAGTADRGGVFMANLKLHQEKSMIEVNALTMHEAVPGHHHQISLAQEIRHRHKIRNVLEQGVFAEGWGLYCEGLGEEMGFYEDPFQYFGRLEMEMLRAIRPVVDSGLHALGWSIDDCVVYMKANLSGPVDEMLSEARRYAVCPGQACAYKIGELKIWECRRWAERELGMEFDVREFHECVLGLGTVALGVVEKAVREWVAQEKIRLGSTTTTVKSDIKTGTVTMEEDTHQPSGLGRLLCEGSCSVM